MSERTETGWRLRCVCGGADCTASVEVEVFPAQDIVLLLASDTDTEMPFSLSELRQILAEEPT